MKAFPKSTLAYCETVLLMGVLKIFIALVKNEMFALQHKYKFILKNVQISTLAYCTMVLKEVLKVLEQISMMV